MLPGLDSVIMGAGIPRDRRLFTGSAKRYQGQRPLSGTTALNGAVMDLLPRLPQTARVRHTLIDLLAPATALCAVPRQCLRPATQRRRLEWTGFALVVASFVACGHQESGWKPVAMNPIPEANKQQIQKALGARDELAKELLATLTTTIADKGAAAAIAVCREAAPKIAVSVSARLGVQIGRTSDRLRNPSNIAPLWAEAALASRPAQPTYLSGPGGELGALLPIRIQATCLLCHGPAESTSSEVAAQLAKLYKGDAATGYKLDDLRGWFWVEIAR